MSLRSKIIVVLLVVFGLYAGLDFVVQWVIVYPSFEVLEREAAKDNMSRCVESLRRESTALDWFCHDWSPWDDLYQYAQDRNQTFVGANLTETLANDNRLSAFLIYSTTGELIWGQIRNASDEPIEVDEFPSAGLSLGNPLLSVVKKTGNLQSVTVNGIIKTSHEPLLFASRPIVTTNHQGPARGAIIVGRFLDADRIKALSEQTVTKLHLWPIDSKDIPPEDAALLPNITKAHVSYIVVDKDILRVYSIFPDFHGKPYLLLKVVVPRSISQKGHQAILSGFESLVAGALIALLVLLIALQRMVLGPITLLKNHEIHIAESDDLSARISFESKDELGTLAREFDKMVGKLSVAQKNLLEQSYHYGKAEMAAGVLHNLRNSLSPLFGDISLLFESVKSLPLDKIQKIQEELAKGGQPPDREKDLRDYMQLVLSRAAATLRQANEKMASVSSRFAEVERILSQQDEFSRAESPVETVSVDELLKDSIQKAPVEIQERLSYALKVESGGVRSVKVDRVAFSSVIGGLLTNALESILQAGEDPKISVSIREEELQETDMIRMEIRDNGLGIESGNIEKLFQRGFSSKPAKSSALGLHWCANTMVKHGGRLYAESEGLGKGASFILLFPKQP